MQEQISRPRRDVSGQEASEHLPAPGPPGRRAPGDITGPSMGPSPAGAPRAMGRWGLTRRGARGLWVISTSCGTASFSVSSAKPLAERHRAGRPGTGCGQCRPAHWPWEGEQSPGGFSCSQRRLELQSSEREGAPWWAKDHPPPPDLELRMRFYWGRGIFRCNKAFKMRSSWIRVAPNPMMVSSEQKEEGTQMGSR